MSGSPRTAPGHDGTNSLAFVSGKSATVWIVNYTVTLLTSHKGALPERLGEGSIGPLSNNTNTNTENSLPGQLLYTHTDSHAKHMHTNTCIYIHINTYIYT